MKTRNRRNDLRTVIALLPMLANSSSPINTTIASKSLNPSKTYYFMPRPINFIIISAEKIHVRIEFPRFVAELNLSGMS